MSRSSILSLFVVLAGIGSLLAGTAHSQIGPPKQYVSLQSASPGSSQAGNANISGRVIAGQFQGDGSFLTGLNASQLTSGILDNNRLGVPMTLSGNEGVATFRAINTSTVGGSAAILGVNSSSSGVSTGVQGRVFSESGYALFGEAVALTGNPWGVVGYGYSNNGGGGVLGMSFNGGALSSGVSGQGHGNGGYGVRGVATWGSGNGVGVYGEGNSSNGVGVKGVATSTSGQSYGGYFQTSSPGGNGIYAISSATSGQNYGGFFQNMSPAGFGVWGANYANSGVTRGVYGLVGSPDGRAVHGESVGSIGLTYGGYFESYSSGGRGVHGVAHSTSGNATGVSGSSTSPSGSGVFGETLSTGNGVAGFAFNGGTGVYGRGNANGVSGESSASWASGVYGFNSSAGFGVAGSSAAPGWAIYGFGNSGTTGTKSFRIDHPLDPESKYLLHYSTEMPEPQNAYNGLAKTDANGYAWVELPDYFEEINRDFRYQITVIDDGDDFVMAKVTREIVGNRFQIRTSQPNVKVSWEVKAIRNDRWVREYGAPAELEKEGLEKGVYQHPELYGQPKERGALHRLSQSQLPPSTTQRR